MMMLRMRLRLFIVAVWSKAYLDLRPKINLRVGCQELAACLWWGERSDRRARRLLI